jgi:pimeloyl-ACP methyl ester carboxylesterase
LHGFGSDADNWVPVSKILTRHFRVIAPDLPGFGRSEAGDALEFDIASHVARVREFILALGVRPSIVAGSSMGGWVATAYAKWYPDEISALWLLAPLGVSACRKTPMLEAIELDKESPFRKATLGEFKYKIFRPMFGKQPWLPFPMLVYYAQRAGKLEQTASQMFKELWGKSESLESIAREIELPVLLQWGDRDNAVDVSGAKVLQDAFENVIVKIHGNTGHLPMLERPDQSGNLLLELCKQNQLFES